MLKHCVLWHAYCFTNIMIPRIISLCDYYCTVFIFLFWEVGKYFGKDDFGLKEEGRGEISVSKFRNSCSNETHVWFFKKSWNIWGNLGGTRFGSKNRLLLLRLSGFVCNARLRRQCYLKNIFGSCNHVINCRSIMSGVGTPRTQVRPWENKIHPGSSISLESFLRICILNMGKM